MCTSYPIRVRRETKKSSNEEVGANSHEYHSFGTMLRTLVCYSCKNNHREQLLQLQLCCA